MDDDWKNTFTSTVGIEPDKFNALQREPSESEMEFFSKSPHVGGYAAEDSMVVLNPKSKLSDKEKTYVKANEAARIFLRTAGVPKFGMTEDQAKYLSGNEYAKASDDDRRATILARQLTGDPTAGNPTDEQKQHLDWLRASMQQWLK